MQLTHSLIVVQRQLATHDSPSILHVPDGDFCMWAKTLNEMGHFFELAAKIARPAVDQHNQFQGVVRALERSPASDSGIFPIYLDADILLGNGWRDFAVLGEDGYHRPALACILRKCLRCQK